MINSIFKGVFDLTMPSTISLYNFFLCIIVSLLLGLMLGFSYSFKKNYHVSFVRTLTLLPSIVCIVIMVVNGNVGTGVAVAGAFSLVRFRSMPGSANDIGVIFIAMAIGLLTGMGYLGYATVFSLILCGIMIFYVQFDVWNKEYTVEKQLIITIPEDLDYTNVFDDLFNEYTNANRLVRVKTTDMGSLFKLTYMIDIKDMSKEKEFIDQLRCRNGNLEIMIMNPETEIGML